MYRVPSRLRTRIAALGELSRPLGEARAAEVAREVARGLIGELSAGRDPEQVINLWVERVAAEILAKSRAEKARAEAKPRMRSLKDLLPEVG